MHDTILYLLYVSENKKVLAKRLDALCNKHNMLVERYKIKIDK